MPESTSAAVAATESGQLIVLESTTYPGTTEEVVRPMLESDRLRAGRDFFLAFSPERVGPANAEWNTGKTPKVVAGTDGPSTEVAFAHVGLDWHDYVRKDPRFLRPAEGNHLIGDASKARRELGWEPSVDFGGLVRKMVDADLDGWNRAPAVASRVNT